MTTNKGGKPQKTLTPEQVIEVGTLSAFLSQEQIADYFGIARNTFTAICERQPEVFEQYKKGKARAIGTVAKGLIKQAMDGNTSAAMFYLKTQAGWRETSVQEEENKEAKNNPKNTITINVVDARKNAKSK
jgi:hypothetical protein